MFSTGQIYFAIFFVIAFILVLIFVYRKDLKQLQKQYKGTFWILISFILFIILLVFIKKLIKI